MQIVVVRGICLLVIIEEKKVMLQELVTGDLTLRIRIENI